MSPHPTRAVLALAAATGLAVSAARAADGGPEERVSAPAPYGIHIAAARPTQIRMSNRDINRINCIGGKIEDYRYSSEKGMIAEEKADDLYVKYQFQDANGLPTYVTQRTELFVRCAGQVFTLYAEPTNIPSQTIFLEGKAPALRAAGHAEFAPLSQEERALRLTRAVLLEDFPESYRVTERDQHFRSGPMPGLRVAPRRAVRVEGTRLEATEWLVRAERAVVVDERMFLRPEYGGSIYAVTIDAPDLRPGETARIVVISRQGRGL